MRQSKLFTKTRKEAPKDEVSKNAELLIRAGFIHKEMAGVYSFLPLGLRVIKKIQDIIREEMNNIGGQEIYLPALQDKILWQKTDRWDDSKVDNWFKTNIKNGAETGLGLSHEEPLTNLLAEYVSSYRDLPILAYQFQTKFRNEMRAKSGIMRGREFLMKDMYSFARTQEEHQSIFLRVREAYKVIFERVGLGEITYLTFASGGIFSKDFSEEFQTLSEYGEDNIFINEKNGTAINNEILEEALEMYQMKKEELISKKAIEVGNIFHLGTKFSSDLNLHFKDENGDSNLPIMGCYGIGISRLMGTIAEVLSDEKGLVWPASVSPFDYHLLEMSDHTGETKRAAEKLYERMSKKSEVLYDDREINAGNKFADADLIGIPNRIIVGSKHLKDGNVELFDRKTGKTQIVKIEDF
jgi:prolyl-tRNA synthetase